MWNACLYVKENIEKVKERLKEKNISIIIYDELMSKIVKKINNIIENK